MQPSWRAGRPRHGQGEACNVGLDRRRSGEPRAGSADDPRSGLADGAPRRHWGIDTFRRTLLAQCVRWPQGALAQCEKLERLRAREHGATIPVLVRDRDTVAVDVPADLARAEAFLASNREQILAGG